MNEKYQTACIENFVSSMNAILISAYLASKKNEFLTFANLLIAQRNQFYTKGSFVGMFVTNTTPIFPICRNWRPFWTPS